MAKSKDTTEKAAGPRRGRPPIKDGLTGKVALRVLPEDEEGLASIAKTIGFQPPEVARAALRLGLTLLEIDQSLYMVGGLAATKRKATLRQRLND